MSNTNLLNQKNETSYSDFADNSSAGKRIVAPRSWLFVPASRPERFSKALATGADAVIIDLEDAVSEAAKAQARANVAEFFANELNHIINDEMAKGKYNLETKNLKALTLPQLWIRLNNTKHLEDDLVMCGQLSHIERLAGVVLPKVTTAESISKVHGVVDASIVAQIESALGVSCLTDIAKADGLHAISFGRLDICNDLNIRAGSQAEDDFFKQLRLQMLMLSRANGLMAPIESVYADFKDTEGLTDLANYANDLGFSGMLCIHPSQVSAVNQAFGLNQEQIDFAKQVVAHYDKTRESVFAIDEVMVDLPVILQCQRMVGNL